MLSHQSPFHLPADLLSTAFVTVILYPLHIKTIA
jgi:hypothetical protein